MRQRRGFTLIEMVVVVAIIGLLLIIAMMAWRNQLNKARDAQRKEDLQRISVAFEEYFSDFGCYPPADILNNCGGGELKPYLDKIPCDPVTGDPYEYVPDGDQPACPQNFRVLARLGNGTDPIIASLNCAGALGCGWGGDPVYNYGVSSKNVAVANAEVTASPTPSPQASPSPQPSPSPSGNLACDPTGQCNVYADPEAAGCPVTFTDPAVCQAACDASPTNWCNQ